MDYCRRTYAYRGVAGIRNGYDMNTRKDTLLQQLGAAKLALILAEQKQARNGRAEDIMARLAAKHELDVTVQFVLKELKSI